MSKAIEARARMCNCYEIGIDTDSLLFALMKMQDKRWEHIHAVKECPHWEKVMIKPLKKNKSGETRG